MLWQKKKQTEWSWCANSVTFRLNGLFICFHTMTSSSSASVRQVVIFCYWNSLFGTLVTVEGLKYIKCSSTMQDFGFNLSVSGTKLFGCVKRLVIVSVITFRVCSLPNIKERNGWLRVDCFVAYLELALVANTSSVCQSAWQFSAKRSRLLIQQQINTTPRRPREQSDNLSLMSFVELLL